MIKIAFNLEIKDKDGNTYNKPRLGRNILYITYSTAVPKAAEAEN